MTTLQQLINKSQNYRLRMPSIKAIHKMLDDMGVAHSFRDSRNIVEYGVSQSSYVNTRKDGKIGYKLTVDGITLDTSDSYYSFNSDNYARKLVSLLTDK